MCQWSFLVSSIWDTNFMATQKANVSVPVSEGDIFLQAQARTRSLFLALLLWNIRSISGSPLCWGWHCALLDTFSEVSPKMPCENMSSPGTLGRTEKEGGVSEEESKGGRW